MNWRLSNGTYSPPTCTAVFVGQVFRFWPVEATIVEIQKYAGTAVGSAVVSFRHNFARDAEPEMGREVRLQIGGDIVFRGTVGQAPFVIGTGFDEVELLCFDDKWGMSARIVGQPGIGTQGSPAGSDGFKDVGFDLVFNRDGRPNKDPSSREFNTGSTAVYWTLRDVLLFLFDYYVADDVARIAAAQVAGSAYDRAPSHLNLVGQTALQAVDNVAQLSGESWGLTYGQSYSSFQRVAPGAGTLRTIHLFSPGARRLATEATPYHASDCRVESSILEARDTHQAISAHIVKESTYTNTGSDPLLTRLASYSDKEYAARFAVDVTQYLTHSLGGNLSAGAPPKPWLTHLLTRRTSDASGYVTAAQIVATPALAGNATVAAPVLWLSGDGKEANARLCVGGVRIDCPNATIDLKDKVTLMLDAADDDGKEEEEVTGINWSTVGLWLTVATVLETPQSVESDAGDTYLPAPFYQLISKPDLVPERRQDSWLPDPSGNNNAITKLATSAEEQYVDVTSRLEEAVSASLAASPAIATPLTLLFPFVPTFDIGDRIRLRGRNVNLTGNEVVTRIVYNVHEAFECRVQATNVLACVDPDQFLEPL